MRENPAIKARFQPSRWHWLGLILLIALGGLYFYLMRPDVAGILYDDGMYLMSAKALASGHGYRLMGIEGQPYFYKYPPLYPLCLAALWLINPHFPANIVWLKAFNILLSLGTLNLLAYHFRRNLKFPAWLSLALVACFGLNFRFIDVSIELMSEPLFMLLSVGALVLAHHYHANPEPLRPRQIGGLMLLSVAAYYTRSFGLVLVAALAIWLWIRKERKAAILFATGCGLCMLPWVLWSGSRPDTTYAVGDFLVRTFQETYFQSFKMDLRYEYSFPELYSKGLQELIGNFSVQLFPMLEWFFRQKATIVSESIIMGLSFGSLFLIGSRAYPLLKARQFSPSGLYISLYCLVLPCWSFFKFYPRFIIVILPFFLASCCLSLQQIQRQKAFKTLTLILLPTLIISTNTIHLWPYLQKPVPNTLLVNPYHDLWRDIELTSQFLSKNTPPDSLIYSSNRDENYLYALFTSRTFPDFIPFYPKVLLDQHCPTLNRLCIQQHLQYQTETLYHILQQKNVRYVIFSSYSIAKNKYNNWMFSTQSIPVNFELLKQHPLGFTQVMETPDGWISVYRFHPKTKPYPFKDR